jgi:hypothetical protein
MPPGDEQAPPAWPAPAGPSNTGTRMKIIIAAVMLLAPLPAAAQTASPEQSYLTARDSAIKSLAAIDLNGPDAQRATKIEQAAIRDLTKRLESVIGRPALKGVSGAGKFNIEALMSGDIGFGMLDGLAYTSKDEKTRIVVSTETLTTKWLVAHKDWWPNLENVPQDIPAAFKSEPFYAQATSNGAAVAIFTELPIARPAAAKAAAALLVARRQDIGPSVPDEILAASVQGGRVYIVSQRVEGKTKEIPACIEIWSKALKEAEVLFEAYKASDLKDEKAFEGYNKTQEAGDTGMRKCYGERVKNERYFADLTKAAQALLDSLPEK